jgi:hypothetical protein
VQWGKQASREEDEQINIKLISRLFFFLLSKAEIMIFHGQLLAIDCTPVSI